MGKFDFMSFMEITLGVLVAMIIFKFVSSKLPSLESGNLENADYADYADYYEGE